MGQQILRDRESQVDVAAAAAKSFLVSFCFCLRSQIPPDYFRVEKCRRKKRKPQNSKAGLGENNKNPSNCELSASYNLMLATVGRHRKKEEKDEEVCLCVRTCVRLGKQTEHETDA